ncbi:alpha/beta fold hydrolase [Agromyces bracchium]|uniref:Alpha/beta fold hydrolase n=2 Tax=Agromyces bracchium TaxID=88376 RepID=A0A6I3M9Q2_9MICO|nr:alpha/beta fold hydrolase [Agromyces bracchium]
MPATRLQGSTLVADLHGTSVRLAMLTRPGTGIPLVFLHGFGSTKEDYADVIQHPALDTHPVIAYDAPGCGASTCDRYSTVDIPFLTDLAREVIARHGYDRVILVGHSMGGLTALRLATQEPDLVAGIIDIEGNLAPEDCFLSRQIIEHPRANAQEFLDDFRRRVSGSRFAASAVYAVSLQAKVSPDVVAPIFTSMVDLSDNAPLLEDFLGLPCPRILMYGEQNAGLSYLSRLAEGGVELAEIPLSGHFPMYSNPPAMWHRIAKFVDGI